MFRLPLVASLFAAVVVLNAGCGSAVKRPTASVRSANLGELTPDGLTLDLNVDVGNPNGFALPVSAASYKLGIAGVNVVSDTAKPTGSVPANGTLPVTVPVTLNFKDLFKAERAIVDTGGNVPYKIDGQLEFAAGPMASLGQGVTVPLKYDGTLPLRDFVKDPVALMKSPGGRRLVELVLGGKNPLGGLLGR